MNPTNRHWASRPRTLALVHLSLGPGNSRRSGRSKMKWGWGEMWEDGLFEDKPHWVEWARLWPGSHPAPKPKSSLEGLAPGPQHFPNVCPSLQRGCALRVSKPAPPPGSCPDLLRLGSFLLLPGFGRSGVGAPGTAATEPRVWSRRLKTKRPPTEALISPTSLQPHLSGQSLCLGRTPRHPLFLVPKAPRSQPP